MPPPRKTPEQKQHDKLISQLIYANNVVLSAWQFNQIPHTWEGVYNKLGIPREIYQHWNQGELTYQELIAYLKQRKDDFEKEFLQKAQAKVIPPRVSSVESGVQPSSQEPAASEASSIPASQPLAVAGTETRQVSPPVTEQPTIDLSVDNDYGLIPSPNERAKFFWFQKKAISEGYHKLVTLDYPAIMILAPTGSGKTWMSGGLIRRMMDNELHVDKTMSHIPYVYVTRASIVTKTERDLEREFNITVEDCSVINIEMLRSQAGAYWLRRETKVVGGEEEEFFTWKSVIKPYFIEWDECQALKNSGSLQHQIACALTASKGFRTKQAFVSATPFTKVSEAKCFAISTRKRIDTILGERSIFPEGAILTEETWPTYARIICGEATAPDEYNEAAVKRLMDDLDDYVIRVKNVRPQFEPINRVEQIDFQSKEAYEYYKQAWERYLEQKRKLEALGDAGLNTNMQILVQFLKFRMAAEYVRHDIMVDRMINIVNNGKAAVCAVGFKQTIIAMVMLFEKRGVPRDKISIIWGGGQTALTDKQKQKQAIMKISDATLEAQGMTRAELLEDLDLEDVEDRVQIEIPEHLRLGMQSLEERQREIDKFQRGETLYCIYTLRAGGVGLSLHHTDEWLPKDKQCRRKESGYVVEEDIPKIPTRPRESIIAPTWSPIELVQGVGRSPRLTSLSVTIQILLFYKGTIESRVADIASRGLRCLSAIVKHREPWVDFAQNETKYQQYIDNLPTDVEDSHGIIGGSPVEE